MSKRFLFLLTCLMLSASMAFAQVTVTGKVIDAATGEPVIGASVRVEGALSIGAATDVNGQFTLNNVPSSAKNLLVSYIGMQDGLAAIKPNMTIYLKSEIQSIDEVFVVAFGTATKETFTGSATVVGADDIAETQSANVLDALKGKAAGVQMFTASGQPGQSSPTIRIRGINSINAGKAPLVVLDGAPFEGDINTINPNDIESMTVLKDAASTALYGARGANGVIMITSKSGKLGDRAQITFDAKWGSNSRSTQRYKTINTPGGYYEMYYAGLKNYAIRELGYSEEAAHNFANNNLVDGSNSLNYNIYAVPAGQYLIGTNGKLNPNATLGNVVNGNYLTADDWVDAAFKHGFRQEYTVSATQSNETTNFLASFAYLDNEGITFNSDFERITGRLKADTKLKDWLRVGANMSYSHYEANTMSEDGTDNSSGNIFAVASQMAPIYPLYIRDANGNIIKDSYGNTRYDYGDKENAGLERPEFTSTNAISDAILDNNSYEGNAFTALGFAEFRFLNDFKFTSNNSITVDETRGTSLTNPFYGTYADSNGILNKSHGRSTATNFQQMLEWHKMFDKHDINVMLTHEAYRLKGYSLSAGKTNMFDPTNLELAGAVVEGTSNSYTSDYNTEAWLGRAQYNYDEKYFGMVSFRRDASSRFHPDNRWGSFWSWSAAWLINKEEWFNADWVDMLKLKVSYGENGNDDIGNYRYTNTYGIINGAGHVAVVPGTYGKKDISWETVQKFNVGVDFDLFNGRFGGSLEWFHNKTADMLLSFPLAPTFGYTNYYANVGDMVNKGFELSLEGTIIKNKELTWDAYANITFYKNKISYLPEERKTMDCQGVGGYSSSNYFYGEGKPMYTFRMPKFAGVNEEGNSTWFYNTTQEKKDAEGNVMLDENGKAIMEDIVTTTDDYTLLGSKDYYLCGTALPTAYGGFGTSAEWKGFDASITFSYQLGGKVYDSDYQQLMSNHESSSRGHAMHADLYKAWSETNPSKSIPRYEFCTSSTKAHYAGSTSSRWLTSASYLSINNINLGYTLPSMLTRNWGIEKLRVYFAADNVCVWSKRQGLDPRQSMAGSSTNAYYAPMRAISAGLSLTF